MKLIDKNALVAEITKRKDSLKCIEFNPKERVKYDVYRDVLSIINTLKVKEAESMQEDPCDGCINRKGCITCENGELRETMQEEPIYKDYRERYKRIAQSESFKEAYDGKSISDEKPVSEELEEEIDVYLATKKWREINETFSADRLISFARHFAKWQEKKDQSTIELAEDHAMLAGMEKMKEQMMAKAVDGEIGYWNIRGLSVNMDLPRTLEEGDKVKLIIIKED